MTGGLPTAALAGAAGTTTDGGVTGLVTAPSEEEEEEAGAAATAVAGPTGGTTRSTWPTSIRSGFSRLFQRTMFCQLWPVSLPMRRIVSPGRTA
ncbi:hypothetical protein QFZ47_000843 [Variovorax paradoxus]|nr:hypothetical protein [Variovorax paradoxus]